MTIKVAHSLPSSSLLSSPSYSTTSFADTGGIRRDILPAVINHHPLTRLIIQNSQISKLDKIGDRASGRVWVSVELVHISMTSGRTAIRIHTQRTASDAIMDRRLPDLPILTRAPHLMGVQTRADEGVDVYEMLLICCI